MLDNYTVNEIYISQVCYHQVTEQIKTPKDNYTTYVGARLGG